MITLTVCEPISDKDEKSYRLANLPTIGLDGDLFSTDRLSVNIDQMSSWRRYCEIDPGLGSLVTISGHTYRVTEDLASIDARYKNARSCRREP